MCKFVQSTVHKYVEEVVLNQSPFLMETNTFLPINTSSAEEDRRITAYYVVIWHENIVWLTYDMTTESALPNRNLTCNSSHSISIGRIYNKLLWGLLNIEQVDQSSDHSQSLKHELVFGVVGAPEMSWPFSCRMMHMRPYSPRTISWKRTTLSAGGAEKLMLGLYTGFQGIKFTTYTKLIKPDVR